MVTPAGRRRRAQLVALGAAALLSIAGGVAWARATADDPVDARLSEPGSYLEPGASTNPPQTGRRLPDVEYEAADGTTAVGLASDGRPMVVNVWFSSCAPCARELGDFATVEGEVGDRVRFIGVNPQDDAEQMVEFASARGVDYELWMAPYDFVDELRLAGFPATFFVDADGTILEQTGVLDDDDLRSIIGERFGVT